MDARSLFFFLPMRRAIVLSIAGGVLVLGGMAWLAAAQLGGKDGSPPGRAAGTFVQAHAQVKVDLNQAKLEELSRLPGITLILAERIARQRPYRKLDDLVTRKVLGKKQFARIREYVVVSRETQ